MAKKLETLKLELDPNSFHKLAPSDQGLALLALLWMADNVVTLEDIMEPDSKDTNAPPIS